jgi:hypothetical protein
MIRGGWWLLLLTTVFVAWEDSAENPVVFCYRISWGLYLNLRFRALAVTPISTRNEDACWNRSGTCSTLSTTSKG